MVSTYPVENKDFRNLVLWHNCRHLILALFELTSTFPESELHGLAEQIRNSCIAITSNIAQAFGNDEIRKSHFFNLGISKTARLKTNLLSAKEKGLLNPGNYEHLTKEVDKIEQMLSAFVQNQEMNFKN